MIDLFPISIVVRNNLAIADYYSLDRRLIVRCWRWSCHTTDPLIFAELFFGYCNDIIAAANPIELFDAILIVVVYFPKMFDARQYFMVICTILE